MSNPGAAEAFLEWSGLTEATQQPIFLCRVQEPFLHMQRKPHSLSATSGNIPYSVKMTSGIFAAMATIIPCV